MHKRCAQMITVLTDQLPYDKSKYCSGHCQNDRIDHRLNDHSTPLNLTYLQIKYPMKNTVRQINGICGRSDSYSVVT